jgi:hypothetical protein
MDSKLQPRLLETLPKKNLGMMKALTALAMKLGLANTYHKVLAENKSRRKPQAPKPKKSYTKRQP